MVPTIFFLLKRFHSPTRFIVEKGLESEVCPTFITLRHEQSPCHVINRTEIMDLVFVLKVVRKQVIQEGEKNGK
jgi:hypothetical protein